MAQSKSFVDHVKKELECAVCQEQFSEVNEPKILKCLHTFCKTCLEAWLRRQREGELSCPTCRQITECSNNNTNSLPSNLFYKQMVVIVEAYSNQAQETDSPRCGNCEEMKSLKFYCFDCNKLLCEDCAGAHKKWKSFRDHTFKEIGSFESTDLQDYARKASVCKKHKDELRFYCEKCNICICLNCAILEHRDDRTHNIISLELGLQNKQSDITQKMQDVKAIGTRLRDKKKSLEKRRVRVVNSIDQTTKEVHRFAEHWISLIRQHESTMTEKLLEQEKSFQAAFSAQMTGLDEKLMEIDGSLAFGNNVLERKNLPEILNIEELMEQRFQELSSSSEFHFNLNYSGVKYVPSDVSSINDALGKLVITNTEPTLSVAQGKGLTEGLEGEDSTFMITTKDPQSQTTYSEIDSVMVDIRSLKTGRITKTSITDLKNGRYEVKYKPEATGEFSVSITVRDEAITGSPFQLQVKERMSTSTVKKKKQQKPSAPRRINVTQTSLPMRKPECLSCMNFNKDPVSSPSQCGHGHYYCHSCIQLIENLGLCPHCDKEDRSQGNQPAGLMTWITAQSSLPGYEDCEVIIMSFTFHRGIQGPEHPNPGQPYSALYTSAFLPGNSDGKEVCSLLERAFNAGLLFTIGTSPTTGEENKIIWNGIELKSNQSGGPASYGYPDPSYLDRVKKQLAEKGITQLHG